MGFKTIISIGYKNIFDDFDEVEIRDLILDIPSKNSLEIIGYFNAQLHTMERDTSKQIEFLKIWMYRLPAVIQQRLNTFIQETLSKQNTDFNFINNISSLKLVEYVLQNYNELDKVQNLTTEQELNLFKAYLFCSQEWTDKQLLAVNGEKIKTPEELINLILPVQLPYQEILEFKDFRIQFIEAIYFFRFCEYNQIFKNYLKIFLDEYKLETWQKYLINILSIYVRKFEPLKTPSIINISNDFPDIIDFLDSLSISISDFSMSDDFLSLRQNPIYKIDNNNFLFLNLNFLVDKIFQGIQFEFSKVLIKNKAVYKGKILKYYPDFKSAYGEEFSEIGLCYQVLSYAFDKSNYLKFKGNEIKKILGDGEPDYYMRDKSKVYLFEYKDVLLNAKIKHSYNIDEIKSEISKKLVQNEQGSAKGVSQLVNVIEKVRLNEFKKFDNYDFENVIIYPILIYTDFSFNISGINYFLNTEFRKQIKDRNIKNSHLIKDLVLIDLDMFIKFQDLFRDKRLKLNNCLNEFYEFKNRDINLFNKISTFNMFIHNKTMRIPYKSPKMLMEEVKDMIINE